MKKILHVDKAIFMRTIMGNLLKKRLGYEVISVENPEEALQLLRKDNFDLLIYDYNTSEMDIHFFKKEAQKMQEVKVLPSVVGSNMWATIDLAKNDMYPMIYKPYDEEQIVETVEIWLKD